MPNPTCTSVNKCDGMSLDHLSRLGSSEVLTQFQVDQIATIWPHLDADTFAHPYFKVVPEHTRAYLEREAESCR